MINDLEHLFTCLLATTSLLLINVCSDFFPDFLKIDNLSPDCPQTLQVIVRCFLLLLFCLFVYILYKVYSFLQEFQFVESSIHHKEAKFLVNFVKNPTPWPMLGDLINGHVQEIHPLIIEKQMKCFNFQKESCGDFC